MKQTVFSIFFILLLFGCDDSSSSDVKSDMDQIPDQDVTTDEDVLDPVWAARYKKADESADAVTGSLITSNNAFALSLFKKLADNSENLFISPFSISTALSMALNGASGSNLTQMQAVLGYDQFTLEKLNGDYLNLLLSMDFVDMDLVLHTANSVWIAPAYEDAVLKTYIDTLEKWFLTGVFEADTPESINSWVENETGGKIKDLIDQFPPDLIMYLINVIYFKASWTAQFDPAETYETDFTLADQSKKKVQMMKFEETAEYVGWVGTDVVGIRLPYGREKISFYAFAPQQETKNGIDIFLEALSPQKLEQILASFSKTVMEGVHLPRFKIEWKLDLKETLRSLGMTEAFEAGGFHNLADMEKANPKISRVIHQSVIEVNEEGTEAAAATAVEVVDESVPPSFRGNRPFIFLIRDDRNGAILFMGLLNDPANGDS